MSLASFEKEPFELQQSAGSDFSNSGVNLTVVGETGAELPAAAAQDLDTIAVEVPDVVDWSLYRGFEIDVVRKMVSNPSGTECTVEDLGELFPQELGPGRIYLANSLLARMSKDNKLAPHWSHDGNKNRQKRRYCYTPPAESGVEEGDETAIGQLGVSALGDISTSKRVVIDTATDPANQGLIDKSAVTARDMTEATDTLTTERDLPGAKDEAEVHLDIATDSLDPDSASVDSKIFLDPATEGPEQPDQDTEKLLDEPARARTTPVRRFERIDPVQFGTVEIHPNDWTNEKRREAIIRILNPEAVAARTMSLPKRFRTNLNSLVIQPDGNFGRASMNGHVLNGTVIKELMNVLLATYLCPPFSLREAHDRYGLAEGLGGDALNRKLEAMHKECLQLMAQGVISYDPHNRAKIFLMPLTVTDRRPRPALLALSA